MENFFEVQRKKIGLTQRQIAKLAGVCHQAVSRWGNRKCAPSISKATTLAKIYMVSGARMQREIIKLKLTTGKR
jgi:transcriptional regulator with XRE-family HTH domain